jgi:hypothetical protein
VLGVEPVRAVDDRFRHVDAQRLLASRPARAEHVQRDTRDDGRQPAAEVLDLVVVGAAEPQPRFLDGVVRLGERAEHPERHRPQVGPVLLEAAGQQLVVVHLVTSSRFGRSRG